MTKNLSKVLLVLGAFVLVFLALIALKPVDGKVVAADPTATPAPTPTPVPFTAKADVVAMYPAMGEINPANSRPKGIAAPRGDDPAKTYAVFSPGMKNVSLNVPVYVEAGAFGFAKDAKAKDYTWELKSVPSGSKAKIEKVAKEVPGLTTAMASFTPDVEGDYVVSLVVVDNKGAKSLPGEITITGAKYVGSTACQGCHKEAYEGWSKTAHGTAFERYVSMNVEAEYWTGGFNCARCHTVGYYPVAGNGGFWDTFVNTLKMNWSKGEFTTTTKDADGKEVKTKYNSLAEAIAFNGNPDYSPEEGPGPVYGSLDPKLQAVSNIGCESCHGPASVHAAKPSKENAPVTSADSSSCLQCHNAGGHHTRGSAMLNSAHSHNAELEEGTRAGCNACHSAEGFVDVVNGVAPDKARAINSDIGCATCHNPHSEENTFLLRQVDTAKIPTAEIKDAGLSAACISCHNNRTDANNADTGVAAAKPSYPHYSSAAEQLTGVGGYTFGATLQNSFHLNIGKAPLKDEAGTALNGGAAPGSCVLCHMAETPGGVGDTADTLAIPGHQKVGGHSFNMAAEEKGKLVENVSSCQQCHPGITTFNFTASADYDADRKVEGVQDEIKGLLDMTWNGIIQKAATEKITVKILPSYPYYSLVPMDETQKTATPSTELKAAIYNYRYVYGLMWNGENKGGLGKAAAVHNFERSVGLLQVTIEKMTGKPLSDKNLLYTLKK